MRATMRAAELSPCARIALLSPLVSDSAANTCLGAYPKGMCWHPYPRGETTAGCQGDRTARIGTQGQGTVGRVSLPDCNIRDTGDQGADASDLVPSCPLVSIGLLIIHPSH